MSSCRRWVFAVLGAGAVVWAALAPAGASAAAPPRITATLPGLATVGKAVVVAGRVSHAPAGSTAELEARPPAGGAAWTVLAKARISSGRFKVDWTPQTAGRVRIRAIVVRRSRTIAATRSMSLRVGAAPVATPPVVTPPVVTPPAGPAPVPCAPATSLTPLPSGTGLIVGGVYDVGGPPPGVVACQDQPTTLTVTDSIGSPVASLQLAAGQSYAIVVPAGSYTLSAGACRGTAVVTDGATTQANTVCDVP